MDTSGRKIVKELTGFLEHEHVPYELLPHFHTESACDEAAAIGIPPAEVAKTIVLTNGLKFVRAVIPASERLDLRKVHGLFEWWPTLRLATEAELAGGYPGFELGAVPPVGGPSGDCVIVDRRLAELDSVVLEAGTHDDSLRVGTRDLLIEAGALLADICATAPVQEL